MKKSALFLICLFCLIVFSVASSGIIINFFTDITQSGNYTFLNAINTNDGNSQSAARSFTRSVNLSSDFNVTAANITFQGARTINNWTLMSTLKVGRTGGGTGEPLTDSAYVYVPTAENTVIAVNVTNMTMAWNVSIGNKINGLAFDSAFVFVCYGTTTGAQNTLTMINISNGTIARTSSLGLCSSGVSSGESKIIATNISEFFLYAVNASTSGSYLLKINKTDFTITSVQFQTNIASPAPEICEYGNMTFVQGRNFTGAYGKGNLAPIWNSSANNQSGLPINYGCVADSTIVITSQSLTGDSFNATTGVRSGAGLSATLNKGCGDEWNTCPYLWTGVPLYKSNLATASSPDGIGDVQLQPSPDFIVGEIPFGITLGYIASARNITKWVREFPTNYTFTTTQTTNSSYTNASVNGSVFVDLNATGINNWLTTCNFGWCSLTFTAAANSSGTVSYSLINFSVIDLKPPFFINNVTNTTSPKRGDFISINTNISEGNNLSSTTFQWNGGGSGAVNDSSIFISGTNYSFSVSKQVGVARGATITIIQYANDTAANTNQSKFGIVVANTAPGTASQTPSSLTNVSTATTSLSCAAGDVDNDTLNFELYADSGTNPPTTLRQNTTTSSVSQSVTSGSWFFRCRAHDSFDAGAYSGVTELYVDNVPPLFNSSSNNASQSAYGSNVSVGVKVVDDRGLSFVRLADNQSGGFVNGSLVKAPQPSNNLTFNSSILVNMTRGKNVCGLFWANDTLNNPNTTTSCFDVNASVPVISNLTISPSPANVTNLTGFYRSTDVDNLSGDTEYYNETDWFVNGGRVASARNQTVLQSGNVTSGDAVIYSARSTWNSTSAALSIQSNWQNSSTLVIGDTSPPNIAGYGVNATSILTTQTLNFTVNATKTVGNSNVQFVTFTLNTPTATLTRSMTFTPAKSVNVSYCIFCSAETANAGTYNITQIIVNDSSNNANATTITNINFTLTAPSSGGGSSSVVATGGGGGGGSPCKDFEFFNRSIGVCVPVASVNLTAFTILGVGRNNNVPEVVIVWRGLLGQEQVYRRQLFANFVLRDARFLDNTTGWNATIVQNSTVLVTTPLLANSFTYAKTGSLRIEDEYGRIIIVNFGLSVFNLGAWAHISIPKVLPSFLLVEQLGVVVGVRYVPLVFLVLALLAAAYWRDAVIKAFLAGVRAALSFFSFAFGGKFIYSKSGKV